MFILDIDVVGQRCTHSVPSGVPRRPRVRAAIVLSLRRRADRPSAVRAYRRADLLPSLSRPVRVYYVYVLPADFLYRSLLRTALLVLALQPCSLPAAPVAAQRRLQTHSGSLAAA